MKVDTLILAPARSGSKGIPDKNIKFLGGKPLLAWTAEAIFKAALPASLAVLSTDAEKYAELGRNLGLHVPFMRPAHLAGDDTAAITVVLHALEWFEKEYGYLPKQLMWLQPTSPFRSPRILHQALDILINQQADAVVACQEIYRDLTSLFRIDHDFMTALQKDAPYQSARQHIKPLLTPNGALYLCKTGHLLAKASFYPDKTAPLIMNKVTSLDIDTEEDWAIAEAYIKQGLTG